jgi:hypothetical protein
MRSDLVVAEWIEEKERDGSTEKTGVAPRGVGSSREVARGRVRPGPSSVLLETRHSPDEFSSPGATALYSFSILFCLVVRPLLNFFREYWPRDSRFITSNHHH